MAGLPSAGCGEGARSHGGSLRGTWPASAAAGECHPAGSGQEVPGGLFPPRQGANGRQGQAEQEAGG